MELPVLLLTPTSAEFLGQALLGAFLLAFLIYRRCYFPDSTLAPRSFYLILTVLMYVVATAMLFIVVSLPEVDRRIWIRLTYPAAALMLFAFGRFIVWLDPLYVRLRRKSDTTTSLLLGSIVLSEVGFALFQFAALRQGIIHQRSIYMNGVYLFACIWLSVVLMQQIFQSRVPSAENERWSTRFLRVQDIPVGAARSYLLITFLLLIVSIVTTIQLILRVSVGTSATQLSILSMVILTTFVLIYVNNYATHVSFVVQATALMSVLTIVIVSTTGRTVMAEMAKNFPPASVNIAASHFGFAPMADGGYRVELSASTPPTVQMVTGQAGLIRALPLAPGSDQTARVDLPFVFPFFGVAQRSIYVHPTGFLTFGAPQNLVNLAHRYGNIPAIFVLHRIGLDTPSVPDDRFHTAIETSPEHVRIIWYVDAGNVAAGDSRQLLEHLDLTSDGSTAVQVQLNVDGTFSIDHLAVAPVLLTGTLLVRDDWRHWVGIHDGHTEHSSVSVQWHTVSNASQVAFYTLLDDYSITVRRLLHPSSAKLALLMIFSILMSVGSIPLFLRVGFMQPLQRLLEGIERTHRGDLSTLVPVHQRNEIGVIAEAFNSLVADQRHLLETLEQQVQDRTRALAASNAILQREVELRRNAQAALEQLNQDLDNRVRARTVELSESEDRFRRVFASVSDHIYVLKLNEVSGAAVVEYASPNLQQFADVDLLAGGDMTTGWRANCVDPEDWDVYDLHEADLFAARNSRVEYRIRLLDGSVRWVSANVRCEHLSDGLIRCYGVMSDITARKQLEQETAAHAALQEVERLRSEWIGNMSHELRTPLGLIKGAVTTLLAKDVAIPPGVQQRILTQLDRETDLLTDYVGNLLDLSRLEGGRLQLNYERTDIKGLLQEVIDGYTLQMRLGGLPPIQFELVLASQLLYAEVDRERLKRVVQNLLTNAMRFSPENSVIRVYAALADEHLVIKVEDHGIGIDEVDFDRIFERYYQVKQPGMRNIGGVGLGLAICREIVKAHGGNITVASRRARETEPGWTMFVVCLPHTASIVAPIVQEPSSQHA